MSRTSTEANAGGEMKKSIYSLHRQVPGGIAGLILFASLGIAIAFFPAAPVHAQTAVRPAGGGTTGDPFQIDSLANLYWITQNPNTWDSVFVQTADIDASSDSSWASGQGFTPIGNNSSAFWGMYDGGGHTISGLYINRGSTDYVAMFGEVQNGLNSFEVSNVNLTNVRITGGTTVGGLIGYILDAGPVSNCSVSGTVSGSGTVGGLVASLYGTVLSESYSTATINFSTGTGGGLVGLCWGSASIRKCYSTGSVNGAQNTGGLVGSLSTSGNVSNSYTTGSVAGSSEVGGLVGYMEYASSINNSFSTGSVSGTSSVGGMVGYVNQYTSASTATASFWNTQTSGQSSSALGTGATTAQMTADSTYTAVGWDFSGTWAVEATVNNGYPGLVWQSAYAASAPTAVTDSSTNVKQTTATVYGTVAAHKGVTTVQFIYGTVSGTYPDTLAATTSPLRAGAIRRSLQISRTCTLPRRTISG